MAAKAVRDIPEVPHEGAARGRYRKTTEGISPYRRGAPYINLFVA